MSNVDDGGDIYCEHCGGCGFVGCDGIKDFLKEHVLGKTNCLNESSFIHEILEAFDETDTLTGIKVIKPEVKL